MSERNGEPTRQIHRPASSDPLVASDRIARLPTESEDRRLDFGEFPRGTIDGGAVRASPRLLVLLVCSVLLLGVPTASIENDDTDRRSRRPGSPFFESSRRYDSAVLAEGPKSPSGWTMTVDPRWFGGELPRNHLSPPGSNTRIEVDRTMDEGRIDPDRIVAAVDDAEWWFNPGNGVAAGAFPLRATFDPDPCGSTNTSIDERRRGPISPRRRA